MSDLTLNGARVLEGTIARPRVGAWHADLVVDAATAITGAVTLASADGALSLRGAVVRGGVQNEVLEVRVVGGAGGLGRELAAKAYRGATVRMVLADLAREAGEAVSSTIAATVLDTALDAWARERGTAVAALRALADTLGLAWRVLADGSLWLGAETWAAVEVEHALLRDAPAEDRVELATEHLPAGLAPGTTFLGRRVSYVEHHVGAAEATTVVLFERASTPSGVDRIKAALEALVRRTLWKVDYATIYPARVVAQAADGAVDVRFDTDRLGDMQAVPLRVFVPGAVVKVAAGARLLVGFDGADPRRPYAMLFESGSLTELEIATAGGARIKLTGADVQIVPGALGTVMLGETNPANLSPLAAGGDAVSGAAITPVPTRNVKVKTL